MNRQRIVLINLVFGLALLATGIRSSWAQGTAPILADGNSAKDFVAHLSSEAMQGRASGTPAYDQAAAWAASKFQEWGLQPAGEEGAFFQKVKIRGFEHNLGIPTLKVGAREFLLDDGDFSVETTASSPNVTVAGEVVFVGCGISAPDKGLDEYAGLDVNGKIVLAFTGSPKDVPATRRPFEEPSDPAAASPDTPDWTEESKEITKIRAAYQRGAAAILLFDPDEPTDAPTRSRRAPRGAVADSIQLERGFLAFTITERVFRAIVRTDPQESPRGLKRRIDNLRRDIQKKQARSVATGVQVALKGYDEMLRIDEKLGNDSARNVLAKLEGSDPELKNQIILIGAHLDHVGVRNGYVYNGADDNASGSGVVLEVARAMAQNGYKPRRTVIFALWSGEELGLLGSLHYTKQPCGGVTMDQFVGSFNLDMVGMGEKLEASGALNFPAIWEVIQKNQDPEIMKIIEPSTGGPGGSDHSGFIVKGIETLFLMSSGGIGHQDYHQPEDDVAKIEPEMMRKSAQFVLQGTMNLADETAVNLQIARRQEMYDALRLRIANLNSQVKDSSWSIVDLKADNSEALYAQVLQQVRDLMKAAPPAQDPGLFSRRGGGRPESGSQRTARSITRGLVRMDLIGTDLRLLDLVVELNGIGRVDIAADNAFWVKDGRLTAEGRTMLAALQERRVAVHLMSPSPLLWQDVLAATNKPFAVTGTYEIPEEMISGILERGIQLGLSFDPKAVPDFLTRVEQLKTKLGERRNLFTFLVNAEGLEEAKTPLYLGLLDQGWGRVEIQGDRTHRGLLGGAALSTLVE